jgi:CRISPR-associated protein Csm1
MPDYTLGPCRYNGRLPADRVDAESEDGKKLAAHSPATRSKSANALIKFDRLLVLRDESAEALRSGKHVKKLELPLFGFALAFTNDEDITGKFGELASDGSLRRCWDFSAPERSRPRRHASPVVRLRPPLHQWLRAARHRQRPQQPARALSRRR